MRPGRRGRTAVPRASHGCRTVGLRLRPRIFAGAPGLRAGAARRRGPHGDGGRWRARPPAERRAWPRGSAGPRLPLPRLPLPRLPSPAPTRRRFPGARGPETGREDLGADRRRPGIRLRLRPGRRSAGPGFGCGGRRDRARRVDDPARRSVVPARSDGRAGPALPRTAARSMIAARRGSPPPPGPTLPDPTRPGVGPDRTRTTRIPRPEFRPLPSSEPRRSASE